MVYCWLASLIGCTRLLSETRKPLCSSLFFLLNRTVGKSELILLLGQPRQFFFAPFISSLVDCYHFTTVEQKHVHNIVVETLVKMFFFIIIILS